MTKPAARPTTRPLTVLARGALLALLASPTNPTTAHAAAPAQVQSKAPPKGVVIAQEGLEAQRLEIARRIEAVPRQRMKANGLAGAMGGARVKVLQEASQMIEFAIPQLTDGQVPISLAFAVNPPDALIDLRLSSGSGGNTVVVARLTDKPQEVQITWASVVLVTSWNTTPDQTASAPYLAASPCVQSKSEQVAKLADALWPASGKPADFAANIQRHIAGMKRERQPMSLDALGILASGDNSICTANSNLAAALMRAKGVPCRTIAVIPPLGLRFEMHRTSEYADGGRWVPFDPSSVHSEIPARSWHGIVLAKTTIKDEQVAMMPRPSTMRGVPRGQSVELLTSGLQLTGSDYLWSIAAPLAEFEASEDATHAAAQAWKRYLDTGSLAPTQLEAGSAKTAEEFAARIKGK